MYKTLKYEFGINFYFLTPVDIHTRKVPFNFRVKGNAILHWKCVRGVFAKHIFITKLSILLPTIPVYRNVSATGMFGQVLHNIFLFMTVPGTCNAFRLNKGKNKVSIEEIN